MNKNGVESYYFGCIGQVGHYWWEYPGAGGQVPYGEDRGPWGNIDRDWFFPRQHDGVARLHHKDGWTCLALNDSTVDSRPFSRSAFLFKRTLDFNDALAAALEHWPEVTDRWDFAVVPEDPSCE